MSASYRCSYCRKWVPTLKGLRSHMMQCQACREALWQMAEKRMPKSALADNDVIMSPPSPSNSQDEEPVDMEQIPLFDNDQEDLPSQAKDHSHKKDYRARVEEVEDEEAGVQNCWVEDYPTEAEKPGAKASSYFEDYRSEQVANDEDPWAPFRDEEEWELAQWLILNVGQNATDKFLKLPITRNQTRPSFKNKCAFCKCIDTLPRSAKWTCDLFEITGDELDEKGKLRKETLHLWKRDPVECVQELIGNPAFREKMRYAPEKAYKDSEGKNRIFDEMWTGDWWWDLQKHFKDGITIAPVILASDKTHLSNFSGDKTAWPVYLTIDNIEKSMRCSPSEWATVLIGYISASKLECFSPAKRQFNGYQVFHDCMAALLEPLCKAGREGVDMVCADGFVCRVFPILAAYVANYPEQCLVACNMENQCPRCVAGAKKLGRPIESVLRDANTVLEAMEDAAKGNKSEIYMRQGLRPINPFWKDLPHCNIFSCFTPDILHQLHKGVFKDHIVKWATKCLEDGSAEIDRRFCAMPRGMNLRHFKKGISLVSQWTGTEYKNMEKVFLGVLAGQAEPGLI